VGGELLFDTNAVIAWMEDDPLIFRVVGIDLQPAVSIISVGELEFGAAKSTRVSINRDRLQRALMPFRRLTITDVTARHYGETQAALRRSGAPIPTNDVWIAAIALEHRFPLLTRDGHFDRVAGLHLRSW